MYRWRHFLSYLLLIHRFLYPWLEIPVSLWVSSRSRRRMRIKYVNPLELFYANIHNMCTFKGGLTPYYLSLLVHSEKSRREIRRKRCHLFFWDWGISVDSRKVTYGFPCTQTPRILYSLTCQTPWPCLSNIIEVPLFHTSLFSRNIPCVIKISSATIVRVGGLIMRLTVYWTVNVLYYCRSMLQFNRLRFCHWSLPGNVPHSCHWPQDPGSVFLTV